VGGDGARVEFFSSARFATGWADTLGFCRFEAALGRCGYAFWLGAQSDGVGGGRRRSWALGIRVLDRRLRLLVRNYAPGFHSFFGGAPDDSGMQNELGGIAVFSGRGWRL
jgi:hypothetical protein